MNLSEVLQKALLEGQFWTHSKTLVEGCSKISSGCVNCWSESMQMRFNGGKPFSGAVIEHWDRMLDILPKGNRGRKPRVWAYWNDVFHEGVSESFLTRLFNLIDVSQDYHIVCTKRPERAVEYLTRQPGNTKAANLLIMVTMENQEMVQKRWKAAVMLASIGVKVGLLIEPMLTPIKLDPSWLDFMTWIICGPENGKNRRPFDSQWAMRLQVQAQASGVPFYFKGGLLNGERCIETP